MKTYNLKIKKIVVVLFKDGKDLITIYTDKPSTYVCEKQQLILESRSTKDTGVDYVRKNFGIEPEINKTY